MATQQVKKTVTRTSRSYATSESSNRSRSQSPARISRLQEKDELTGLNDRLATYIDHIRSLESENQRLHLQITSFEETSHREVSNIKELYEKELAAARKLIDDVSKENAQLTVSVGTYKSECEEWMRKYTQRDKELINLKAKMADLEAKLADTNGQLASATKEVQRWKDDYMRAKADLSDLERQLASARKQLEEETLAKVDLENRVQSLKEELQFKAQLYQSELNETRTRMEYSMEEVDSRAQQQVESRLQEALADLRQQHEAQTSIYREEMESVYSSQIASLQKELADQGGMDDQTRVEISAYKTRLSELQSQISKLTNQNATLEARIAEMEATLAAERQHQSDSLASKDREIALLRQQMSEQMLEYQDLLDIKVSLDLEIAAYRKLLEGEEDRLNLSQSSSSVKVTPRKRRREDNQASTFIEETQSSRQFQASGKVKGCVEICEVDETGKFVRVKNNSDKEVSLGGWKLVHKAGSAETDFKFHRTVKLQADEVATVWSSDCDVTHDAASHQLVMKSQRWMTGDDMNTTLTDKEGAEQASLHMCRTAQRTILKASRPSGRTTATGQAEEAGKCSIM